jgi:hypothetical protein
MGDVLRGMAASRGKDHRSQDRYGEEDMKKCIVRFIAGLVIRWRLFVDAFRRLRAYGWLP